jgi:poly-gamma-glutamate synthesis protein (capsule biosynthesis protein)
MQELFGDPDDVFVKVVTREALTELALTDQAFLTLLPFEELTPHWKVLRVDGQSPIDDTFAPENYPLTVHIWLEGDPDQILLQPAANYDADRRTVLMMTGVTALTRATAHRMETQGNHYPGRDIQPWLASADLVHISNEVPFARNCPYPDPFQSDLIFCSSPDRIELLEFISTDIIELSGNHTLDYGVQAMNLTLEMYAERGWVTYAGGWDLQDARSPALITHHGNRLAFLGCNPVGPPIAWATNTRPGAAPCGDYQWLVEEIQALRAGGYLPIVTLQYVEDYTAYPSTQMVADFQRLANAGALIVNGSQSHTPKSMVFYGDSFLHYGLGNLFFDQMEVYYNDFLMPGTREAFIDRLVFYDGDLISVELLTTMLEDYARPRPMTPGEREALLSRIFPIALQAYE